MFRSKNKPAKPSSISNDVADLINEIDTVAAPFDESIVVTKDPSDDGDDDDDNDTVLVDDGNVSATLCATDHHHRSPDHSMQVSELSTSLDELALLEESIKNVQLPAFNVKKDDFPTDGDKAAIVPSDGMVPLDVATDDEPGHVRASFPPPPQGADLNMHTSSHDNDVDSCEEIHVVAAKTSPTLVDDTHGFMDNVRSSMGKVKNKPQDSVTTEDKHPAFSADTSLNKELHKGDIAAAASSQEIEANKASERVALAEDEFNPFVNIGNRLLDSDETVPQDDDSVDTNYSKTLVYKQLLVTTGKVVLFVLQCTVQLLGVCARNVKPLGLVLVGCALGMYLMGYLPFPLMKDSVVDQEVVSSWNLSMMEELSPPIEVDGVVFSKSSIVDHFVETTEPPFEYTVRDFVAMMKELTTPIEVEEVVFSKSPIVDLFAETNEPPFESTVRDFVAMMKVLALSVTIGVAGFSILGMQSTDVHEGDNASTYTKNDDDRSRYDNLNLKELKRELRARKLCTTGIHGHLVDRLVRHDNGGSNITAEIVDIDVSAVERNATVKVLQEKLRSRKLPATGLKEDLITKMWIPARVEELKLFKKAELRKLLKDKKLPQHGKSKDELIRRLIEAGH